MEDSIKLILKRVDIYNHDSVQTDEIHLSFHRETLQNC